MASRKSIYSRIIGYQGHDPSPTENLRIGTMKNGENKTIAVYEVLLKMIAEEAEYHSKKETLAWIASSVYFAFSLFLLNWLFHNPLCGLQKWALVALLTIIYVAALSFISLQFLGRWQSVERYDAYNSILRSTEVTRSIRAFKKRIQEEIEKRQVQRRRHIWEILLFSFYLFIVVPWVIVVLSDHKKSKKGSRPCIDSRYRTEIPTYAIITAFFAAQLLVLRI